jgi:hypothetical protein
MMLAAAERTTQVRAARIPGMGEKADPAVNAGNHTSLQFRLRRDSRVQPQQILLDYRPDAIVLMPIRPNREELPDGDDKKAKFSATIPMSLCTPSSYLTEANASRGRARFFCAPTEARPDSRIQRPNPHRPPHQICSPTATLPPSQRSPTTTWKKRKTPSSFQVVGQFSASKHGEILLSGKDEPPDRPLRVLARRGGQVLSFVFHPGDMGVTTRNHFEGRPGTLSFRDADAREHPAGKTIGQYLEGLRRTDTDQLTAALCPDGYHFHRGLPGGEVGDPITHANALDVLPRALSRLRERWDFSSLRFSDIRLITHANLALGGWHMRVQTRDNGPIDRHVVVALARTAAGWRIVGTPWQDDHILGLP